MILRHLKRLKADVALLQETHLDEKDFFRLRFSWVGKVFGSSAQANKAEVITLIHKNLNCEVTYSRSDMEGRWSHIVLNIGNQPISIFNVYGPNTDSKIFYRGLETHLHLDTITTRIVGGDFNSVVQAEEDRKGRRGTNQTTRVQRSPLPTFLHNCHLVDAWRALHPDGRECTHFSHPHNSWSRIDYMLLSQGMMQRVESLEIGNMVISDHSPVIAQLTEKTPRGKDYLWRFPTCLASDEEFQALHRG